MRTGRRDCGLLIRIWWPRRFTLRTSLHGKAANVRCLDSLEQPWIYQDPPPPSTEENEGLEFNVRGSEREYEPEYFGSGNNGAGLSRRGGGGDGGNDPPVSSNSSSSMSLGDTHIWRD